MINLQICELMWIVNFLSLRLLLPRIDRGVITRDHQIRLIEFPIQFLIIRYCLVTLLKQLITILGVAVFRKEPNKYYFSEGLNRNLFS